jgi:hypothetical protein
METRMDKRSLIILTSILGLTGCTHSYSRSAVDMPPGKYERTTRTTDASGTVIERKTSTKVTEDDGDKKVVSKSKTTEDPEGWFNKRTTAKSKEVIEEDNDGDGNADE